MAIRTQWHPKELRSAPDELAQIGGMLAAALGLLRAVPPDRAPLRRLSRSFTLPAHVVDGETQASTDDGVLQIVLPKVDQAMPKRITERRSPANIPIASARGE
jgi:Hsp20/alpha crystallin family